MDRKIIMEKIQDIFRDVFDDEELVVADSTSSDDIEEWDSLSHIQLVVAVDLWIKINIQRNSFMGRCR